MKRSELIPDYRDYLKAEYEKICADRDSDYRSKDFARDIRVSRSFLSQLFGRKAHLSLRKAAQVAESLGWIKAKKQYFLDLVELHAPRFKDRSEASRRRLEQKHLKYERLPAQVLERLTWKHLVLLQIVQVRGARVELASLEGRSAFRGAELTRALETLEQHGLLRGLARPSWKITTAAPSFVTSLEEILLQDGSFEIPPYRDREGFPW